MFRVIVCELHAHYSAHIQKIIKYSGCGSPLMIHLICETDEIQVHQFVFLANLYFESSAFFVFENRPVIAGQAGLCWQSPATLWPEANFWL